MDFTVTILVNTYGNKSAVRAYSVVFTNLYDYCIHYYEREYCAGKSPLIPPADNRNQPLQRGEIVDALDHDVNLRIF
jgi:hypothetical protein